MCRRFADGFALLVGSLIALPLSRLRLRPGVCHCHLAVGVYGLFGFHFLLFLALRHAPPVEANLVNYLWPLGMVVMAPLFLPDMHIRWQHIGAAVLGFAGAAIAIWGAVVAEQGYNSPLNLVMCWRCVPRLCGPVIRC